MLRKDLGTYRARVWRRRRVRDDSKESALRAQVERILLEENAGTKPGRHGVYKSSIADLMCSSDQQQNRMDLNIMSSY